MKPSAVPLRITELAVQLGLGPDDVEPRGWFQGKLALGLESKLADRPCGKYVGVTAISPTPLGEGKTVTAIGLAMGLCRLWRRAIATLRQPSLGPVFGIKGGGAGGGSARLLPTDDINLHFTGDLHAVTSAHNLLAAMLDNHLARGLLPVLDPTSICWRRVIDLNDKGLSHIITGVGADRHVLRRETGFDLTAASEVMAILALSTGLHDLQERLGRIVVGRDESGRLIHAREIGCVGAMTALLRDALRPNLVQTCEHTPALVHTGPFGNIAHGNSSVLADLAAVRLADFVVTESGFGADCGAEKLFDIKCRVSGIIPDVEVLVCTVRALKYQSGRFTVKPGQELPSNLLAEDCDALQAGRENLEGHLNILRKFGIPIVVAVNRFPSDTDRELDAVRRMALDAGADYVAVSEAFARGGEGSEELAQAVIAACTIPGRFRFLYADEMPYLEKLEVVAREIYGADGLDVDPPARRQLDSYQLAGFGNLPVCIAKTQYSFSHDPKRLGRPQGFRFPIREARLAAGAGFVYALAENISTMPGLPASPAALRIGVNEDGEIYGIR
jgi:formate--tetrahydrofolate ligase